MQTEHFTILVGPEKRSFKVPEGRLTMHSLVFKRMCSAPFIEARQRLIKLPEDDPSVFEDFFDWMHSSNPQVYFTKGAEALFALAIFAEKYQICHLINQISDLIKKDVEQNDRLSPEILDQVYSSVPEGAVLRLLCSWAMEWEVAEFICRKNKTKAKDLIQDYAQVFATHPDLGRNFFLFLSYSAIDGSDCSSNACLFHNHSDIPNASESQNNTICPYTDSFVTPPAAVERRASKRLKKNP